MVASIGRGKKRNGDLLNLLLDGTFFGGLMKHFRFCFKIPFYLTCCACWDLVAEGEEEVEAK